MADRREPPLAPRAGPTLRSTLRAVLAGLIIIYLAFNLSLVVWMMRPFYDQLPRS